MWWWIELAIALTPLLLLAGATVRVVGGGRRLLREARALRAQAPSRSRRLP